MEEFLNDVNENYLTPKKDVYEISELSRCKAYKIINAKYFGDRILLSCSINVKENIYKIIQFFLPSNYNYIEESNLKFFTGNYFIYKGKFEGEDIIKFELNEKYKKCTCDKKTEENKSDNESGEESDVEDEAKKKHFDFYT